METDGESSAIQPVTMRVIMKDVGTAPTPVNSVTILRYRVT